MKIKHILIFLPILLIFSSCENKKLTYKKIETKNYKIEGYTYTNYTDHIFPNDLVVIDKGLNDTIYHCQNCYRDFNMILEDTLLIYGGSENSEMTIADKIILKKVKVSQDFKYNIPF